MRHRADHFAAVLDNDRRRIPLQGMAECIIGGEEKPRIAAAVDHLLRGPNCKRRRIEHPLHRIRRAEFAVEIGRAGRMSNEELFTVVGHLLHRQAHRRDRYIDNQVDLVDVIPLPGDAGGDIGLDLMVSGNDSDGLTQDFATKVFGCHLRRRYRTGTGRCCRRPGQICQYADLHHVIGNLRLPRTGKKDERSWEQKPKRGKPHSAHEGTPVVNIADSLARSAADITSLCGCALPAGHSQLCQVCRYARLDRMVPACRGSSMTVWKLPSLMRALASRSRLCMGLHRTKRSIGLRPVGSRHCHALAAASLHSTIGVTALPASFTTRLPITARSWRRTSERSSTIADALEAPSLADVVDPTAYMFRAFAEQTKSDLRALAACMRGSRQTLSRDQVGQIAVPLLVAVGDKDPIAGSPEPLAALIPGAQALAIPGRDHMLAVGDRVFKSAVLEFLSRRP